jgi:hypothetical protein
VGELTEDSASNDGRTAARWRLQFGLRTLMLLTALAAVGMVYPCFYRSFFVQLGCACLGMAFYRIARRLARGRSRQ